MATITSLGLISHLRAEPNQFILHYRNGQLARRGAGLSYWFVPLWAAVAQLPVEDIETTFILAERTADFQEVAVQCTLTYRIVDPEQAAARVNFTISLSTGAWVERPLERLASFWSQRARRPARTYLAAVPLVEAVQRGAEMIRAAMEDALREDAAIAALGLELVGLQVLRVAPVPDLEKALQAPTREGIQQRADEAVFARRAQAVEKERAIKENELATEVELARQQEHLIRNRGANRLLEVQQTAEAERVELEGEVARQAIAAEASARDVRMRAVGEAEARRQLGAAEAAAEAQRLAVWQDAPARILLGLAAQQLAGKIESINHLNLSPDMHGSTFQQFLIDQADRS